MITVTVALPCCCCCCCCRSQQLLLLLLLFIFIGRGFAYWLSLKLTATCTLGLAAASFDTSSSEMLQLASPWIFLLIFIEFFFLLFFCVFFCFFFFWGCLLKTSVNLLGISRVYSSELFTQRVLYNKNENYAGSPSRGIQMEFMGLFYAHIHFCIVFFRLPLRTPSFQSLCPNSPRRHFDAFCWQNKKVLKIIRNSLVLPLCVAQTVPAMDLQHLFENANVPLSLTPPL